MIIGAQIGQSSFQWIEHHRRSHGCYGHFIHQGLCGFTMVGIFIVVVVFILVIITIFFFVIGATIFFPFLCCRCCLTRFHGAYVVMRLNRGLVGFVKLFQS